MFHKGQKGFTLVELLIVLAILGILIGVVVPNLTGFIGTSKVVAANTEVTNVELAALAYYADKDAVYPASTDVLAPPSGDYLTGLPTQRYTFDGMGKAVPSNPDDWDGSGSLEWEDGEWVRS